MGAGTEKRAVAVSTATRWEAARSTLGSSGGKKTGKQQTTGWAPTCEHDADPVPATVLDPFAGAGTVGLVAQRLGRSSVMIELSEEYAEMARDRIAQDMPLFSQVAMLLKETRK